MLSPWCCDIMEIDFVVLGYKGGVALQYQSEKLYGRMVSQCGGVMAPLYNGIKVVWYYGITAVWYYGTIQLERYLTMAM